MSYKSVGDYLKRYGLEGAVDHHRESYCRSSLNRYYYDVFLQTRTLLREAGYWKDGQGHKDLPDMLTGKVKKALKNRLRNAKGIEGTLLAEGKRHLKTAASVLEKQGSLLKLAYETRVLADYEPEEVIKIFESDFKLSSVSGTDASRWSETSARNLEVLRRCFRGLGIVD